MAKVPRLEDDLKALMLLTSATEAPRIPVRPASSKASYVVGDASGVGFGSTSWKSSDKKLKATVGLWNSNTSQESSSNFREAANLVLKLKSMLESEELSRGSEVFIFTDNFVFERTFYKGSSNSKLLHDIVIELRGTEIRGDIIVHVVWISGKRMIAQGSDGLTRGDNSSGVMAGEEFLKYIPLNESAFERSGVAKSTIVDQWLDNSWKLASPADWFHSVFREPEGKWIWFPPPALAKVAVEQLCEAKLVFPKSSHVFVCPALMTGEWKKPLGKIADFMCTFAAGSVVWQLSICEPLTVCFAAPLLDIRPWKVSWLQGLEKWKKQVSGLQWGNPRILQNHMRKFRYQKK